MKYYTVQIPVTMVFDFPVKAMNEEDAKIVASRLYGEWNMDELGEVLVDDVLPETDKWDVTEELSVIEDCYHG